MTEYVKYHIKIVILFVILWGSMACSSDVDNSVVGAGSDNGLNVGFRIVTRTTADEEYEAGQAFENYIDVVERDYRIYFFDDDDKLIARFEPSEILAIEGSDYIEYSVLGRVPGVVAKKASFKVVVLANWPTYVDDSELIRGTTTNGDICRHNKSQFDQFQTFELSKEQLIPFFGVREFEGVTFESDVATILTEPITMLRAVAKVEVVLQSDIEHDLSLDDVQVCRYNKRGYCSPNANERGDYDHDGAWDEDYAEALNLVNDKNDVDANNKAENKRLAMLRVNEWEENGTKYEKWIAYLTEYQNIDAGDDFCYIEARFKNQVAGDIPHTIYFAQYSNGQADNANANRLNVERNNIYRFNVVAMPLQILVSVDQWVYGGTVHIEM